MSKTYNLVGGGNVEKAVLAVTVTNGTPTSVTATNGSKTVNLTRQSVLPVGYTQLEYIESTGAQYINSGVECTSNLVVDMTVLWFEATNVAIAGGINVSGPPYFRHHLTPLVPYSTAIYWCQYNGDNYASIEGNLATNTIHTVHVDPVNGIAILDGDTKSFTPLPSGLTTGYSYGVMARIASTGAIQGKASRYYYFACSVGGQTLRKMYPARRNSDSVLGMYDTVNNVFYTNAGTGTFIAGPELSWTGNVTPGTWTVTATDGTNSGSVSVTVDTVRVYSLIVGMSELGGDYTKLEWIYSDPDTAQIDTGYKPTTSCRLFGKFAYSIGHVGTRPFECEESDSSYRYYFNLICDSAGTAFYCGRRTLSSTQNPMTGWGVTSTNTDHTYSTSGRAITMDGVAHTVTEGSTFTVGVPNMYISKGVKTYYFQMTGTDGSTLVRDMIPAKRNLDSVVGMYDKVNGVFYSSRNEYVYTAGPAV